MRRTGTCLLLLIVSCGLSQEAKRVQVYTKPEQVKSCELIGTTHGHAGGWGERYKFDAYNDARENAAELGADALLITGHTSGFSGHDVEAEAFRCPTERPVAQGAAPTAPTAPPAPTEPPPPLPKLQVATKIVVLGFRNLEVKPAVVEIFTNLMSSELEKVENLTVVDRGDMEAVLDAEKTKDLLGCDTTSCLAEVAGAMGANLILYGSVGSLGEEQYAITASVFDNSVGKAEARISRIVEHDPSALAAAVPGIVAEIAGQMAEP